MLSIFDLKSNKNNKQILLDNISKKSKQVKHFPPLTKEWNNGIYAYNNNTLNLIPISNKLVYKLIKNYFNLYNCKLELKIRRQKLHIKSRRLSSHKLYISKGEFKHTNNKVFINIYIYNRQRRNYIYKKRKIEDKLKKNFFKRINLIKNKVYFLINKTNNILLKHKNTNNIYNFLYYNNMFLKKYIKKSLKREMLYIYYLRILTFNNLKFKYTYLQKLSNLIKKIYHKNIEFNIINLKYYYLNSDIITESIINKITKNRKKLFKILKNSVQKVKIANKNWMQYNENFSARKKLLILNRIETKLKFNTYLSKWTEKLDPINNILNKTYFSFITNNKYLKRIVLNSVKNKTITGVRIEIAGRLSKRHTASKSLFKLRYKGSLKNKDSSFHKLSSLNLRRHMKSNIQHTKLNSVARIGTFGIKGWISNN